MTTATAPIPVAGTALAPLPIAAISRTTLALFAGASGDTNPVHIDLDAARSAGLDDVFAHGMLSMAYLGRLLTSWFPQSRWRHFAVRFVAITPVHAAPTCHGTVRAVAGGTATVDLVVRLADGTTTVTGTAVVDLAREPGDATP